MSKLIDGKAHSAQIREEIKEQALNYYNEFGRKIQLAVLLVGKDPASQTYVKNKVKACEEVGILSTLVRMPENSTQEEVEDCVKSLCNDIEIDGVLIQLPLPKHLDERRVLSLIPTSKDVDGFTDENVGALCLNKPGTVSCTPLGIMKMLEREGISVSGKNAVVVGRSAIVGKPMAMLLLNADATVTVCHSKTENLKDICSRADILVAAVGKPKFITEDMVKGGAVVIDVGMDRDENGKLCGDVDFENVEKKCSYITPVPGGVGPMTVTMLLYNTVNLAFRGQNWKQNSYMEVSENSGSHQ